MRPSQLIVSTALAASLTAVAVPAPAAPGVFYDPRNPASPTGKTIGHELFRTIGCPGRELLGKPCPEASGPMPPVASADPSTTAPTERAAASESTAATDRAALAAGGTGPSGGGAAEPAPAAALAAGDQTGTSGGQGAAAGTLVLEDVNFDFDKATLRPDAVDRLQVAANMLTGSVSTAGAAEGGSSGMSGSVGSLPDSGPIEVAGHADSTGPAEYNMGLSLRRANAVRDYLVSKGVAADRLVVRGYGESQPTATNETPEGRAKNRRVELLPQR